MSYHTLRVYQAAETLRIEVDRLRQFLRPGFEAAFAHVDDAVDSIAFNIAEGGDSIYEGQRRKFFDIANGSTREARRGILSLKRRGAFGEADVFRSVGLTIAIGKMLNSYIAVLPHTNTTPPKS